MMKARAELLLLHGSSNRRLLSIALLVLALGMSFSLISRGTVSAQTPDGGFGIGRGFGTEIGINLDTLNQVKADIARGVYDRACTPAEHDPSRWHSLVNVERKCHYDHQHNDDPNYVNDLFGAPGAWFGRTGQSISYPWQTFAAATMLEPNDAFVAAKRMENDLKHEGYIWVVRRDQPCPNGNCITDFRLQTHAIMGAHDMPVRYHSFSLEARLCIDARNPSSCGIVRYGGWTDMGRLFTTQPDVISCAHNVQDVAIPLPADTLYFPLDRPAARDEIRCHPNIVNLPTYPSQRPLAEWWGHAGGETRFQLRSFDPIGNVDVADPAKWHVHCAANDPNCRYDASIFSAFIGYVLHIHEFIGQVNGQYVRVDGNGDGRTDYRGYFDRWGTLNPSCSQASLDCIPYDYNNVVLNFFQNKDARYFHSPCENCARTDYDVSPAGQRWISWFYTKYGLGGGTGNNTNTPTPVPPTATSIPPTSTPIPPTSTPQPVPQTPTVIVNVQPPAGQMVNVALDVANMTGLYGLQVDCAVDPAVLAGTSRGDGSVFSGSNSFFADKGFASDGHWVVGATLLQPNAPFTGNGTAFVLSYAIRGAGSSSVACSALAVDANGAQIPVTVLNGSFNGAPIVTPLVTETVEVPPTVVPATPTATPLPPATDEPVARSTIVGFAKYQNRPTNQGITVQLVNANTVIDTVVTGPDGAYLFDGVPVGSYGVTAVGPQHLRVGKLVAVTADGQTLDQGTLVLPAGDTDDNGTIDLVDAGLVGANFQIAAPPAPSAADLNGDGLINVSDLALVGGNFGLSGPIVR